MARSRVAISGAMLCLLLVASTDVVAQGSQTASLTGTIFDSTHAVLRGAAVIVSSEQQIGGPQTIVTDEQGIDVLNRSARRLPPKSVRSVPSNSL